MRVSVCGSSKGLKFTERVTDESGPITPLIGEMERAWTDREVSSKRRIPNFPHPVSYEPESVTSLNFHVNITTETKGASGPRYVTAFKSWSNSRRVVEVEYHDARRTTSSSHRPTDTATATATGLLLLLLLLLLLFRCCYCCCDHDDYCYYRSEPPNSGGL